MEVSWEVSKALLDDFLSYEARGDFRTRILVLYRAAVHRLNCFGHKIVFKLYEEYAKSSVSFMQVAKKPH